MSDEVDRNSGTKLFGIRVTIGLAQGLALYLLYRAQDTHTWPSGNGLVFAPLLVVFFFAPLAALQGVGNLRTRTLLVWLGTLTLFFAGLAFYDIWHSWPVDWVGSVVEGVSEGSRKSQMGPYDGSWQPHIMPSFKLLIALALGGFISHALISGGDADRRFIASYTTHFDIAWKLGLQFALSAAFVGAFWVFLFLGSALFQLIKLDFLRDLLERGWFWIPITALAASAAIHITDVRAGLVRGARTLALTLLSWLLPLLTLIVTSFLIALLFTGLDPLWSTRSAASLLLISAAALIALINTVYQDGTIKHVAPRGLRYPATLAALLPVPLVALAAYALGLRVQQYGWTSARVMAAAGVFVAACYAGGYAAAVVRTGPWLKSIERWNFHTSLVFLAVLLAIFSPVLDPMRISVASQMTYFESGKTAPEKFDFAALRWDGGAFGKRALEKLAGQRGLAYMQKAAMAALEERFPHGFTIDAQPADRAANIAVDPAGGPLPDSFLNQDWSSIGRTWFYPRCLTIREASCKARLVDLNGDGVDEIVIVGDSQIAGFTLGKNGKWTPLGRWQQQNPCENFIGVEYPDQIEAVPPQSQPWPDLIAKGKRLYFSRPPDPFPCD